MEMLGRILRPPSLGPLRYAAIRESLVAARATSMSGFVETRAWEGFTDYIIDTGEGSCGVVRFAQNCCVGAMINYDPWRQLDLEHSLEEMPRPLGRMARDVCALPLLNSPDQLGISSLFWSDGGPLRGSEPWPTLYEFGGELLRRELLDEELWPEEAAHYYDIEPERLAVLTTIARRRVACPGILTLTHDEADAVLPAGSSFRADAMELLNGLELGLPQLEPVELSD